MRFRFKRNVCSGQSFVNYQKNDRTVDPSGNLFAISTHHSVEQLGLHHHDKAAQLDTVPTVGYTVGYSVESPLNSSVPPSLGRGQGAPPLRAIQMRDRDSV